MRTEIDSLSAIVNPADVLAGDADSTSPDARQLLDAGIRAAQAGNRAEARTALLRSTELDPTIESAWMWLASISELPEELLEYLHRVLEINPENARALEWRAATDSLLSRSYVQRGADAAESGDKESATEFFVRALEHDKRNAVAWMWLATLSESNEGKLLYIEKALAIDPDLEDAVTAYSNTINEISATKLAAAKTAIVENRISDANVLLNLVLSNDEVSTEALWLRCIFAESFVEKLDAFERLAGTEHEAQTASKALDILRSLAAELQPDASPDEVVEDTASDNLSMAISEVVRLEPAAEPERIPTEELEMPAGVEAAFEAAAMDVDSADLLEEPEASVIEEPEVRAAEVSAYEPADVEQVEEFEAENEFVGTISEVATFDDVAVVPEVEAYESVSGFAAETVPASVDFPDLEAAYQFAYGEEAEPLVDADPFPTMYAADISEYEPGITVSDYPAAEPEMPAADNVYSFESFTQPAAEEAVHVTEPYAVEDSELEDAIPMPAVELAMDEEPKSDPYATQIVAPEPATPSVSLCAFCSSPHEPTSIICYGCKAVLSLADIDLLISNSNADRELLQSVADGLELEGRHRELSLSEIKSLGLAHLNLRNLDAGYSYLLRAAELDATDAVLANQVNMLHIRIEEVKAQEEAHRSMPKGKKVLVVDDSPTILKLISTKLEKSGHEVFCSASGEEAMEWLVDMVPDLVLLDINLPHMDGYQVCKLIRAAEATKDVPVVMISGKEGFFDKVRGKMAGVSGHITKPFGPETLMKTVDGFLKGGLVSAE